MPHELSGFQLQVTFYRLDATVTPEPDSMASLPLGHIDWVPALEYAKWQRVSRYPRPTIVLDLLEGQLEPSWDEQWGRPYINGIQIAFGGEQSPAERVLLPLAYFHDAAKLAATQLVEAGQLVTGDRCRFRICAVPTPRVVSEDGAASRMRVESIAQPLQLREGCISALLRQSRSWDEYPEQGLPVFVPAAVLEEIQQLVRDAGATETGGVLIGHLGIDPAIPEIFLHVTAQIPAVHAEQELTSLTLTHQTWTAADAALRLRGLGEQYLGWWHSHPVSQWCADCPEEKRRNCQLQCDFFSAQDKSVHRCCFSRAFQVALVVSDHGREQLSTAMYGWHEGTIKRRRFQLLECGEAV